MLPAERIPNETSSDEEAPLQADSTLGYDGQPTTSFTVSYRLDTDQEMSIKPSVFMHLFYLPEIARMKHGTPNAFMTLNAIILFALTIILQVGLTVIAGFEVMQEHREWSEAILVPGMAAAAENALNLDMPRHANFERFTIKKVVDSDRDSGQCCDSVSCAHSSRSCCKRGDDVGKGDSSGHALLGLRAHHNASNGKPSSSAKKISKGGGGEDELGITALCQSIGGGKVSCADPTMRYTARWDELDANIDGVWSWAEAVQDRENLGCRLGISQEDIFRSVCRAVELDVRDSRKYRGINRVVPQFIKERKDVPKMFFDWYSGLVALCSTLDQVQCSSLVAEGVFDMAMHPQYGSSVGLGSLDSVMDYCNRLLEPDGICSQMMPSTYMVYHSFAADKCGEATLTMGALFRNPYNNLDSIRLLEAEFASVTRFKFINYPSFELFLFLVVMLWFFNLMNEMKETVTVFDFLLSVKVSNKPNLQVSSKVMSCITRQHQLLLGCMVIIRLSLLAYMSIIGTIFLASNHGFIELLCNTVALGFIFELDEFIYMFLVSSNVKKELQTLRPVKFSSKLPCTGFKSILLSREFWGLIALPLLALSFVLWHRFWYLQPVYKALSCLCQKHVDSCVDFDQFGASWWDGFWKQQPLLS